MCGRFSQSGDLEVIRKQCKVLECSVDDRPRYNIAPSQPAQVILNDGITKAAMLRWGLIPSWSKDEKIANRLINARAESLNEKPMFKTLFQKRRCLIPVDGFYEWKKAERFKQPMRILMKDNSPFALAGLWDRWIAPDGDTVDSFTIITTDANDLIKPIHNRMPVILAPEDYLIWLDPDISDTKILNRVLKPFPSDKMRLYAVSRIVNSPEIDSPECIKPVNSSDPSQLSLL
jgi:putative SOS response-associated peptidase YedK